MVLGPPFITAGMVSGVLLVVWWSFARFLGPISGLPGPSQALNGSPNTKERLFTTSASLGGKLKLWGKVKVDHSR